MNIRRLRTAFAGTAVMTAIGMMAGLTAAAPATNQEVVDSPSQTPVCTWQQFGSGSVRRFHIASASDAVSTTMYNYGGIAQSGDPNNTIGSIVFSGADINSAAHRNISAAGARDVFGASAAYRTRDGGELYLLGGGDDDGDARGDVQLYNAATGSFQANVTVAGQMGDRVFAAAAYDSKHDAVILVGGARLCEKAVSESEDAECTAQSQGGWTAMTFDTGRTWQRRNGGPDNLFGHSMVFDSQGERMLVYGGTTNLNRGLSGVQQLDLSGDSLDDASWSSLATAGTGPADRYFHGATYDPDRNWMVIFGGVRSSGLSTNENELSDTWALDLNETPPMWRNLGASRTASAVGAALGYDAHDDLVILHGGRAKFRTGTQNATADSFWLNCTVPATPTDRPPTNTPNPNVPTNTPISGRPTPGPAPTLDPTGEVCDFVSQGRVPNAALNEAVANPDQVGGYNQLCYPNRPAGPFNQLRTKLSLRNPGVPWHPLFNPVIWKCGCP